MMKINSMMVCVLYSAEQVLNNLLCISRGVGSPGQPLAMVDPSEAVPLI